MTEFDMIRAMLERTGDKIEVSGWSNGTALIEDRTEEIDFWFHDGKLTYVENIAEKY